MGGNDGYPYTTGTYEFELKVFRRHPAHWGMPQGLKALRKSSTTAYNVCRPARKLVGEIVVLSPDFTIADLDLLFFGERL